MKKHKPATRQCAQRAAQPTPPERKPSEPAPRSSSLDAIRERMGLGVHGEFARLLRTME